MPIYEWVISLEVAEHIPHQYEEIFLSNLARHAKTGIILSWPLPGQGGNFHVNEHPIDYVTDVMQTIGFELDYDGSLLLQSHATFWWLKNNTNIYYRQTSRPINTHEG